MGARGDLRHHAAEAAVLGELAVDDVGEDAADRPVAGVGASTTATAVSSQLVSMPRTRMRCLLASGGSRRLEQRHGFPSSASARAAASWRWPRPAWCATRWPRRCPRSPAPDAIEIVAIRTTGDAIQDRPLSEAGGKGLFVKEIEEALLSGRIDVAVHCMKDMPTAQPAGLVIAAFLPREDARDVLIAGDVTRIADLKHGAVVGTAALRRQAQLLLSPARPARSSPCAATSTRGCAKRERGEVEATLLALAGLKRLGLAMSARRCRRTRCCPRSARARSASNAASTMRA